MMKENISVVVPVYKSEQYIIGCLNSIVKQTYAPYEIIIVSDGCVDRSIELARSFLDGTDITYQVVEQQNQGVAAARNNGISKATGEWVIAIDSDDQLFPHTFELLMTHIKNEDVATVGYDNNMNMTEEPRVLESDIVSLGGKDVIDKFYKRECKFVSPAFLLKKSFLQNNEILYDEGCRFAEDDIYVWKVLCSTDRLLYIKKPLYNYIFHQGSTMTTSDVSKFFSVKEPSDRLDKCYIQTSARVGELKWAILLRHYIGLIHAAARVQTFKEYRSLIKHYEIERLYKERYRNIALKQRALIVFPLLFPFISYQLFKLK